MRSIAYIVLVAALTACGGGSPDERSDTFQTAPPVQVVSPPA